MLSPNDWLKWWHGAQLMALKLLKQILTTRTLSIAHLWVGSSHQEPEQTTTTLHDAVAPHLWTPSVSWCLVEDYKTCHPVATCRLGITLHSAPIPGIDQSCTLRECSEPTANVRQTMPCWSHNQQEAKVIWQRLLRMQRTRRACWNILLAELQWNSVTYRRLYTPCIYL